MMTNILEAIYQTREVWTELAIYVVFFICLLSYIEYKANQDIKEL